MSISERHERMHGAIASTSKPVKAAELAHYKR
jgi:hypothetical protein